MRCARSGVDAALDQAAQEVVAEVDAQRRVGAALLVAR